MNINEAPIQTLNPVSIVIVNYNAGDYLYRSVQNALSQAAQVIVVDNDSKDNSLKNIESLNASGSQLLVIKNKQNLGFAAACSIGVGHSTEKFILFFNPDCEMKSGSLKRMVDVLSNDPTVGMVGGLLLNPDETEQGGGRRSIPTPWRSFVRSFGLLRFANRWPRLFYDFYLHQQPLPKNPIEVEAISGALMLVTRAALEDVGPWDSKYFLHYEDLDLCMRFTQKNWKILFVPDAPVIHQLGACSQERPIFVEWHKHKGVVRFYKKFFSRQYPGPLMWVVMLGVWLRFLLLFCYYSARRVKKIFTQHKKPVIQKINDESGEFIIQASNIHDGGAKTLLIDLISVLLTDKSRYSANKSIHIFVDTRFRIKDYFSIEQLMKLCIHEIKPTIWQRIRAEIKISQISYDNINQILCFGNLPPLLPVGCDVSMYFQTVLYFKKTTKPKINFRAVCKLAIEKLWIRWGLSKVTNIYVQSDFVKSAFIREFDFKNITVFPFLPENFLIQHKTEQGYVKKYDFFYPAAGTEHKNHLNLIEALNILSMEKIYPTLLVTIDDVYIEIKNEIKKSTDKFNTQIVNVGSQEHTQVMSLYQQSKALIFPSFCESFGLPLVEAQMNQIPVLAPELDYVRDRIKPVQTFDPESPKSIARAIKRHLGHADDNLQVHSTKEFVTQLIE